MRLKSTIQPLLQPKAEIAQAIVFKLQSQNIGTASAMSSFRSVAEQEQLNDRSQPAHNIKLTADVEFFTTKRCKIFDGEPLQYVFYIGFLNMLLKTKYSSYQDCVYFLESTRRKKEVCFECIKVGHMSKEYRNRLTYDDCKLSCMFTTKIKSTNHQKHH